MKRIETRRMEGAERSSRSRGISLLSLIVCIWLMMMRDREREPR